MRLKSFQDHFHIIRITVPNSVLFSIILLLLIHSGKGRKASSHHRLDGDIADNMCSVHLFGPGRIIISFELIKIKQYHYLSVTLTNPCNSPPSRPPQCFQGYALCINYFFRFCISFVFKGVLFQISFVLALDYRKCTTLMAKDPGILLSRYCLMQQHYKKYEQVYTGCRADCTTERVCQCKVMRNRRQ